jgi:hypothetical protein
MEAPSQPSTHEARLQPLLRRQYHITGRLIATADRRPWPMRICAYWLMPNHWHFIPWSKYDGDLAALM